LGSLGVPLALLSVYEILGLDEELLAFVPQPVFAVLLVYPITSSSEEFARQEREKESDKREKESDVTVKQARAEDDASVFFVKQNIANACGTIALIHAFMNAEPSLVSSFVPESFLASLYAKGKDLTAEQRADLLDESEELERSHQQIAAAASSDVDHAANADLHFMALVCRRGQIYELDGRKTRPVLHGPCEPAELLSKAVSVCQAFIERERGDIRFTMLAVTQTQQE